MFRNYHYHHPFIIVVLLVVAVVFIIIIITVTTINLCLSAYPPIGLSATQTHIPSASINDVHEHTHSFQIKTKARIEFPGSLLGRKENPRRSATKGAGVSLCVLGIIGEVTT